MKKELSIVIPVYRAEKHIKRTVDAVYEVIKKNAIDAEIILVNDGSPDRSWEEIKKICSDLSVVVGIDLMKNFGQDSAIMMGLKQANGDLIVVMDDDLQHDPNDIPRLIAEIKKDFDLVYANFDHKKQSLIKNLGSWFNGKVANLVINKPDYIYLSPFKIITSQLSKEILKYDGPYPYVDGLLFRTTKNISQIQATHYAREIGVGNYTLWRSFKVWLNLATSFSILPLRIAVIMGFGASFLAFSLALFYIIQFFMNHRGPSGWASLITTVLFFSGVQLISIGILGEYIGRTHIHVNSSPQSVARRIIRKREEGSVT